MRAAVHELRNHLCIAMAGIEAFIDRKLEPNEARLAAVFGALREVELLIDDLPRDQTVAFETQFVALDVCALIGSTVMAMEGFAAGRGVRLHVDGCAMPHRNVPPFLGDPVRIAQIVTNVLLNAIRYSPPGGDVRVTYRRDCTHVQLRIADDGPGIEPGERGRIFERGYRSPVAAAPSGSGIGLALVKQFIDRQGGTIVVSDSLAGGAVFTIDFPGTLSGKRCSNCGAKPSLRGLNRARPRRVRARPVHVSRRGFV